MRRVSIPAAVLVAAVAVVGLTFGRVGSEVIAQDATPTAAAGHPIIGSWLADRDTSDPANPPSLFIFHDDGTYVQADVVGTGVGAWEATGPSTVALTILFIGAEESGAFGGTAKVRATVEVDESGDAFTADYTLEFIAPDGTTSGELGPATAAGERIAVEPMGTPVGPLMMPEAATPEP